MTSVYRDQVADALRAVRVSSATSYSWFGCPAPPLDRALRERLAPAATRELMVARLERTLYVAFYLRGRPSPQIPDDAFRPRADHGFVEALSRANSGSGGWSHGWRVAEVGEDGTLAAERGGLRVWVDAGDHRLATSATPPAAEADVAVRVPNELREASPGFYYARGDADEPDDPDAVEVRVYFHLTRAGAVSFVELATRLLNARRVAFGLKLLDHPEGYSRCDAAVLYLREGTFARARDPLRMIVTASAAHLRAQTPAFTKPLARGVGAAEHGAAFGASFGIGRCRLLAEGIADAAQLALTRLPDRIDAVARRFARHGLDLDAPYLASREARDDYVL